MKRKYELNIYAPFHYEDLQDHFNRMAAKGWGLESLGNYFFTYQKLEGTIPVSYALAFHPQVGWLDPLPSAGQEIYHDYCRYVGWELIGTWSKFPQIQVYASSKLYPVPIQSDLSTQWRVLTRWMEDKYVKPVRTETALCSIFALLGLLIFGAYLFLVPSTPVISGLLAGMIAMLLALLLHQFIVLVDAQRWLQEARQAAEEGRPGPAGRMSRAWLLSLGLAAVGIAAGLISLLHTVGTFYGAWTVVRTIFVFLLFLGLGLLGARMRALLRSKGTSAAGNKVIFAAAAVILALLYVWVKNAILPF